jgi:predicted HTH transcriptional regulator
MGFNELLFGKTATPGAGIKKENMFTLTNLGRQQVENLEGDELEFEMLSTMSTRRAWSIDDLSRQTKMESNKVRHELKRFIKQGMVKTIGASGE